MKIEDIAINILLEFRKTAGYKEYRDFLIWNVDDWVQFLQKRIKETHGKLPKEESIFWVAFWTENPRRIETWLKYCKEKGVLEQRENAEVSLSVFERAIKRIADNTLSLQEQPQTEQAAPTIPTIYNTEKEKLVFGNALKKQYMSLDNGCYKWALSKSLLSYMCGRLYCGDRIKEDKNDYSMEYIKGNTQMPAQEVKALFDGIDVASNRYSLKAPPRNSWKVDELFKDNRASK